MSSPMRGTGSNLYTTGNQGGGPKKWNPPSSVGVPANLANLYATNSVPYNSMVNSMTITCSTQNVASVSNNSSAMQIYFLTNSFVFELDDGMKISSGSFNATITDVVDDSGGNTTVTYTLISGSGSLPVSGTATYTIKTSGCP
jgi:hypothetical protein